MFQIYDSSLETFLIGMCISQWNYQFKVLHIRTNESHKLQVRNFTSEVIAEETLELVFTSPDINHGFTQSAMFFSIFVICSIATLVIKESQICVKVLNKYISSHICHIFLGIMFGLLERLLTTFYVIDVKEPVNMTPGFIASIRIPILLYASYGLYHPHFFKQLPYIILYGVCGRVIFLVLVGVIIKLVAHFVDDVFMDLAYSQSVTFAAVTAVVDPLTAFTIFKDTSQRNFYLLLGIYVLGNGITVEIYEVSLRLASFKNEVKFPAATFAALGIRVIISLIGSVLLGFIAGVVTSLMTRLTRRHKSCEYYEPFITLAGPLIVYFITLFLGYSSIFGPLTCCILQERYVFMNMSTRSVTSVKILCEALSYLSNLTCFLIVGYKFSDIMFHNSSVVTLAVLTILISYIVKLLIIISITLMINLRKRRPIGTRLQALLVFGGVRGPRSYGLVIEYHNAPFTELFVETQLHLIVFSVLVDTLITKALLRSIRRKILKLKDKHVTMIPLPSGVEHHIDTCMEKLIAFEMKFQRFLVSSKEELAEETRLRRDHDREVAMDELDKKSFTS